MGNMWGRGIARVAYERTREREYAPPPADPFNAAPAQAPKRRGMPGHTGWGWKWDGLEVDEMRSGVCACACSCAVVRSQQVLSPEKLDTFAFEMGYETFFQIHVNVTFEVSAMPAAKASILLHSE